MAKPRLKNINGHFVESDYENALISFLENEGWQYLFGESRCQGTVPWHAIHILRNLTNNQ